MILFYVILKSHKLYEESYNQSLVGESWLVDIVRIEKLKLIKGGATRSIKSGIAQTRTKDLQCVRLT